MLKPRRRNNRLLNYDYSKNGLYYITPCTADRKNNFGSIINDRIILNKYGEIVENQWLWLAKKYQYARLDEYIVMPNHFHGILVIQRRDRSRPVPTTNINVSIERPVPARNIDYNITQIIPAGNINTNTTRPVPTTNINVSIERPVSARNIDCNVTQIVSEGKINTSTARPVHTTSINVPITQPVPAGKIKSLSELIGAFKTTSSKLIRNRGLNNFSWQRSFYDHIIRNEKSLDEIRYYIRYNPLKWALDRENPENV